MKGQMHQYKVYGRYKEYAPSGGGMGKGSGSTKVEALDETTAKRLAQLRQSVAGVEFTPTDAEHLCCQ